MRSGQDLSRRGHIASHDCQGMHEQDSEEKLVRGTDRAGFGMARAEPICRVFFLINNLQAVKRSK